MASFGGSAAAEVEELEEFQRKSAAIETVFTLAILYVSILQIISPDGLWRDLALIPVAIFLIVALLLGGGNLWQQIKDSFQDG